MTDEPVLTEQKVAETLGGLEPNDTKPEFPKHYRLTHATVVRTELNYAGMGHTYLESFDEEGNPVRIDVSGVCQGTSIRSEVGHTTGINLLFGAMPSAVTALGLVEITDRGAPVDWFDEVPVTQFNPLSWVGEERLAKALRAYLKAEVYIDITDDGEGPYADEWASQMAKALINA